jgi:hypothetical protein
MTSNLPLNQLSEVAVLPLLAPVAQLALLSVVGQRLCRCLVVISGYWRVASPASQIAGGIGMHCQVLSKRLAAMVLAVPT